MPKRIPRPCDRCGKNINYETWVHSKPSNKYYCRDLAACGARAKKQKGAAV